MIDKLKSLFIDYSGANEGIDSMRFMKFSRDTDLINENLRSEDIDVLFAKNREPGTRKLAFDGFIRVLEDISYKNGISYNEFISKVVDKAPKNIKVVTIPIPNRFHDDLNTYTGVSRAGGPTFVDLNHCELSKMLDRSIRERFKREPDRLTDSGKLNVSQKGDSIRSGGSNTPRLTKILPEVIRENLSLPTKERGGLKDVFNCYSIVNSTIPKGGIDGAKFLKFCQDAQLFDKKFRLQDVDVVFAKYKMSGLRYITYDGFYSALLDIALRRDTDFETLLQQVSSTSSVRPNSARLIPKANRFHDDISTYTGVHRAGGPTVIDRHHRDLSEILTRAPGT
jgi:hypothetical protein